jgi:hypothetical protein
VLTSVLADMWNHSGESADSNTAQQRTIQKEAVAMKLIRFQFYLFFLLLGWAATSQALEPPTAEQIEQYKKDGSWEERVRNAYAIGNHKMAPELAAKANYKLRRLAYEAAGKNKDEIDRLLPAPPPAWQGMPTQGNVNIHISGWTLSLLFIRRYLPRRTRAARTILMNRSMLITTAPLTDC